jgi:uncharacterized protein (TIGR03000 family)
MEYTYEIRAEIIRDGEALSQTQLIDVQVGQTADIAFDFDANNKDVQTTLTLNVPEGALVQLAGKATDLTGITRQFTTASLTKGQQWKNYTIEVTLKQGEQVLTQRRAITLVGGEPQEVTFAFEKDTVAVAN